MTTMSHLLFFYAYKDYDTLQNFFISFQQHATHATIATMTYVKNFQFNTLPKKIFFLIIMSKLDRDIHCLIFNKLRDDGNALYSCLLVNKTCCEIVIPILWK